MLKPGVHPDWQAASLDASDGCVDVHPGDIVEAATRARVPVLITSTNFDHVAHLRVLATISGDKMTYLCLVTGADDAHVTPTMSVTNSIAREYDIDDRYKGEGVIFLTEFHVRRVVKKQRGRFCNRCGNYYEEAEVPRDVAFRCRSCGGS